MKRVLTGLFALAVVMLGISAYTSGALAISDDNRYVVSYDISVNGRTWKTDSKQCYKSSDGTTGAFRLDWNSSGNPNMGLRYQLFNSNGENRSDPNFIRQYQGRLIFSNWALKGYDYQMNYKRENWPDPSCQFRGSWSTDES